MTDRNQTQPDLLDTFLQSLSSGHPNTPANLDPALASVAVMLSVELTPPDPSARFVRGLEQRLTSTAKAGQSQSATLPPSAESELAVTQTDAGWNVLDTPPRSRFSDFARLAAAVLAIMLIGSTLIFLFSDRDDVSSPGILGPSATEPEILVSWDLEGGNNYKLYVVPVDGSEPRKLTPGLHEDDGIVERFASWSPDGQQVVFVRHEETRMTQDSIGSASDLVIIDADGTNMRTLVEGDVGATITLPVWSPGGNQIAYVGGTEGPPDIRVINSDGSGHTIIDSLPSSAAYPTWSPDGSQIAVATTRHQLLDLWVMNADGSDPHPLVETEGAVDRPVWSPDGRHIAFADSGQLWIVAADGSSPRSMNDSTGMFTFPGWSPDGTHLVYATGTFVEDPDEIAVVNIDGSVEQRWSTGCQSEASPSYSPDGNRIAYHCTTDPGGDGSWELRIAPPDGSDQRTLLPANVDWAWPPAWNPMSGDDTEPQVDEAPTPQLEPTPVIEPTAMPAPLTEPPRVSLTYLDQTQTHRAHSYCWPMSTDGEVECAEADRGPPDLPALQVPVGASLSFEVEGGYAIASGGAAAVRLIPYPDASSSWLTFDFPGTGIPFEQGPDGTVIVADVPDGDYSFEIGITMEVFPGHQGDASYAFRVFVGDPAAPAPEEPERFVPSLTFEDQAQAGIFSYGCNWQGDPACVDPGGLLFPTHALNVPEGATMHLTFDNPADIEITGLDGRVHLIDGVEIGQFGTHSELSYPAPHEETPTMWGSLENVSVVPYLPVGQYALAVTYQTAQGSGTYGFNINVVSSNEPWQDADTIGTIEQIEDRSDGRSVYIIEHPEDPNAGDQYYVTVTEQTPVFERTAHGVVRRTAADLQPGMRLTVAFLGEVATSYPAYARAAEVVIVRTETDGPTDPNDLVVMTFRHALITGFAPIPGGDAFYVAYSIADGASGDMFLCADHERAEKPCTSGYGFERTIEVPRGAELTFTVYRLSRDNPVEPEVVKQGREVVDGSMITRSWYRYGAENPGGY